jgi:hypothetical protein
MNFVGRAERWLQSVERHLRQLSWDEFCGLIHECFDRFFYCQRGGKAPHLIFH